MIKKAAKTAILFAYDNGLIPDSVIPPRHLRRLHARSLFVNRAVIKHADGYYRLDPMPTEDELNTYYENIYWDARGKTEGINQRDIDHFILLRDLAPNLFSAPKRMLNFGAGHGGISHLLWLHGHDIVNVEPSDMAICYKQRWQHVRSIDDLKGEKFDLVYGSHSLEHVQNIEIFEGKVASLLKPNGYVFWEVPNGNVPSNGGSNGVVHQPHTYYFTTKYFERSQYETLLNSSFKEGEFPYCKMPDDAGEVVRFLGRIAP